MRDGTILRADVYRPRGRRAVAGAGLPHPVRQARRGVRCRLLDYVATARGLAARGYVVVVQDVRGRYASDGDYAGCTARGAGIHAADGYDTTEWAAALPGCDGRVGTWGNSYDGYTAMRTPGAAPPSLAAAFASGIAARMQDESRGIFEPLYLAVDSRMAPDIRARTGDDSGPLTREAAEREWAAAREKWLWALPYDAHPARAVRAVHGVAEGVPARSGDRPVGAARTRMACRRPVCHITGWWDFVIRGSVANFRRLRALRRSGAARRARLSSARGATSRAAHGRRHGARALRAGGARSPTTT